MIGAAGPDVLRPGPGFDDVVGSRGGDDLDTRDGSTDLVQCDDDFGPTDGDDRASVDELDLVGPDAGCARLDRLGVARGVFVGYQDDTVKTIHGIEAEEGNALVSIGCSTDAPGTCRGTVELVEEGRSLGSASFEVAPGEDSETAAVALSPADFARADKRAGIRVTLVVRPAGLEEQRLDNLRLRTQGASL